MDRFKALSRGTQLMFAAGVLLLVDSFLSWQNISAKIAGVEIASASANAWHGFWGILMVLLTIALLVWLVVSMLGLMSMRLPISDMFLSAALGAVILLCALLKVLTDDFTTKWAWIGVALAAVVAAGAWLRVQEAGGMDTLRTEATSMRGSRSESPPPPPPAQEPPAS